MLKRILSNQNICMALYKSLETNEAGLDELKIGVVSPLQGSLPGIKMISYRPEVAACCFVAFGKWYTVTLLSLF